MNEEFDAGVFEDTFLDDCGTCEEHFLDEPQDARGLPLSWCLEYEERHKNWPRCCVATYDYSSIPDVAVTNGNDDWGYLSRGMMIVG
jgi:hypothetical protein